MTLKANPSLTEIISRLGEVVLESKTGNDYKKFHTDFSKLFFDKFYQDHKHLESIEKNWKAPKYSKKKASLGIIPEDMYEAKLSNGDDSLLLRFYLNDEGDYLTVNANLLDAEHKVHTVVDIQLPISDLTKSDVVEKSLEKLYTKLDKKVSKKYSSELF